MSQSSEVYLMPHSRKVASLMLDFSALSEDERREFLVLLNNFIFLSPAARRKARVEWEKIVAAGILLHADNAKR
ncbi:hypothetical protein J6358_03450 [Burkholderia pseudomallei]|nr:hypothetical protein [Burkholderia pseudomallei]MBO2971299.1 hypothetical protein [Burkholderia pseudomallei]MBO3058933.1 hypothetical protein [Burkholderia pseudomallei]MBO7783319.1 hypothetical protein [Burkholderia pseudomallei]MBO7819933.1 hypothetical protein [Burkholderia pseudomallei]MBO7841851.1 hypothetical protein [Burkholderia pseudomallei]